ncbi:RNA-directed DNA polymerase, eukaryota, partial [Tanacetum coccineum]
MDRLIGNLCTLWVGRFHLHANAVRYERPSKPIPPANNFSSYSPKHNVSYATAVNNTKPPNRFSVLDLHALVLDDTCGNVGDFSRHVMARVKDFNSIPNLKMILTKEGFGETRLSYLGGLWVMIELNNVETQKELLHHTGAKSWFQELQAATSDFVSNERIVWVDIEGIPLSGWSHATFSRIGKKWGDVMDIEESTGSLFARKRLCFKTSLADNILESFIVIFKGKRYRVRAKELFTWTPCFLEYKDTEYSDDEESIRGVNDKPAESPLDEDVLAGECDVEGQEAAQQHSDDPFGFYELLKKPPNTTVPESDPSLSYPPGFTPDVSQQEKQNDDVVHVREDCNVSPIQNENSRAAQSKAMDPCIGKSSCEFSTSVHSRKSLNGGSILDVLDDIIKVGQSMGYDMEGCSKDIERIIGFQGDVAALQETKMDCISNMDVKFMWGNSNFQFVTSDSIGNSGGILCVWEQSIFKKDGVSVSDNFIALYGTWLPTNTKILIVVIYAPQSAVLKRTLWEYISVLINRWNGETLVLGDFNEVRSEDERFGSIFSPSSARSFNHFIASSGLLDVKMEGYSFTWSHPSASKMSKLDRFLVSDGIFLTFPAIIAVCLDRHLSDHRPIILKEIQTDFGPTPFRLYHSWFKREGFDAMVKQAWLSFSHNDSNSLIRFKKKLQDLKKVIRVWIRDMNILKEGVKSSLTDKLVDIDKELDNGVISDDMLLNRLELSRKLFELKQSDLKDAAQKAKVKWAIEGDENSKFFHGIINKRRAQLAIQGVFDSGVWLTDPPLVKNSFLNHFANRFKQPASSRLKLNMSFPNRLTPDQIDDLDRNISRDEIKAAVWDCGENKSPDPDGFTFEFFRHFWDLIGSDLCAAVNCFFDSGSFPRGCNSSFIALIPKVMDAKFVTDFRPISLIGSVYKVVTKILANRLSMVISDLISNTQSAFVKNRKILDGPFILNEAIACAKEDKQILNVKELPTSEISVNLAAFKQGDPLAPLLFILVMETLHISVSRAVHDGVFKGLQIHDSMVLSHLFYADDVVFVGAWSDDNLANLVRILQCFQLASGLKINMQKSQVLGVGVPLDVVNHGASTIGCTVMNSPFKYLGVTVGDHMSRHSAWSIIIQKIRSRLSMWKAKTLSIGGRLTLLKSVLGAVPLYTMSIYKAPKGVLHEMEMIRALLLKMGMAFFNLPRRNSIYERFITLSFEKALISLSHLSVAVKRGASSLNVSFRRQVRDGVESHQWSELNSLLGSFIFSPSSDRWSCDLNRRKVNVFAWRARLDRLPTRDNLAKRGAIMDSSLCPICGLFPEKAQHLFFGCELARSIALRICHWWNLNWTEISSFAEWNSWSIFDDSPPKRSLLFNDIVSFSFN